MPDDAYDPATLAVLAGMEPPRRPAGFVEERHPVEDGPGSGVRIELTVRVLVGLERSTVIVADPVTGRALAHEVLPHGREADVAAAAVQAAIRARLQAQQPVLDYSHRLLPDGTPRYPLNDDYLARHMRARGFSEADVRHVLGYDPRPPGGVPGGSGELPGEPREPREWAGDGEGVPCEGRW